MCDYLSTLGLKWMHVSKGSPEQNGRHFADDIFQCTFMKEILHSKRSNWQEVSIGSDDGYVSKGRQAIVWTNDDQLYWRIYASLYLNVLIVLMVLRRVEVVGKWFYLDIPGEHIKCYLVLKPKHRHFDWISAINCFGVFFPWTIWWAVGD